VSGVQGFQCQSSNERQKIEEGNRELITKGARIEEIGEFCYIGNVLDCEA